ncbi:MAG: TIGR03985 family CRISPR-associated protein [Rivularia sp. (in: Bacteria)]|nr:TIGR03985 family CRISPR-associated protein [Rivularia sp. MS3]
MVIEIFQDVPHVELLQWFARGSLKQNLLRSIRLWVWLCTLYGESNQRLLLDLESGFTYSQWRDLFFSSTHPKGEEVPKHDDISCLCSKTTADWLFTQTGIIAADWKQSLISHVGIKESKLNKLLRERLFSVTRRSLQGDLEVLVSLGWLVYKNQKYFSVNEFPLRPLSVKDELNKAKFSAFELNFLHDDLVAIAQNHSQEINGIQRFFVHLDYVIPKSTIDLVENWQWELKELWEKTPVPPIKITYNSAKIKNTVECIVYPICIYYVQRAVYLCTFGDSPKHDNYWYNFRLDRIQAIKSLEWGNSKIPEQLKQRYQQKTLPHSQEITLQMSQAWGFDFYLPAQLMLLRFEPDFARRYVKGTERHDTFKEINYQQAKDLIKQEISQPQQQKLISEILLNRFPEDAYYTAYIRYKDKTERDNNVIMRLRAWRPNCEVLLPIELRNEMIEEVKNEARLYL